MDYGFLGEKESEEQVTLVLVIREKRHTMTWTMLVPRRGTEFPWIAKRAAKFIDLLGHNKATLRCDNEPGKGYRTGSKKEVRLCQRDDQWERASPTESPNARWDLWLARPER